jgi:arylsulfatase A-like enzyme
MNLLHASRLRHTAAHLLFVPFCVLAAYVVLLPVNPIGGPNRAPREVGLDPGRPNIVLILTDDQTPYDLRWMPITRRLLGSAGMTFTHALSPHPLCCPARAELLTGQYAQNNGVQHNGGPYGGFKRLDDSSTIATWLSAAGYRTAFLGKYLNGYEVAPTRQRGWDDWDALTAGVYSFRDFTLYNDRADQPAVFKDSYLTDVLTERADRTIRDFAATGDPFFVWIGNVAPHRALRDPVQHIWGPPLPAPRHEGMFPGAQPPSLAKPSFNEVDIADQPADLRTRAPADPDAVRYLFRERIRSLQAVDESVASLVATLDDVGELDNTWIFFVSDNGYSLGEHRYEGKNLLTSEPMAVPLVVRGPGVAPGTWSRRPVTLVDLPVTFAAIAGARPTITVDGSSFLGLLTGHPEPWRDTQLVQTGSDDATGRAPGWAWRGVATGRWTYGRQMNTGERQLYDHAADPFELVNLAGHRAYGRVIAELERRAELLRDCSGATCNRRFGPVPRVRTP